MERIEDEMATCLCGNNLAWRKRNHLREYVKVRQPRAIFDLEIPQLSVRVSAYLQSRGRISVIDRN